MTLVVRKSLLMQTDEMILRRYLVRSGGSGIFWDVRKVLHVLVHKRYFFSAQQFGQSLTKDEDIIEINQFILSFYKCQYDISTTFKGRNIPEI